MLHALLVDDEIIAVNAMNRRIKWAKYGVDKVFTAGSMEQAMEIFKNERVDFMLSDVEMPQGSGLELFEWVKMYYPATECIYVTCHPEYDYMREAMRLGSADYILKPIDYVELDEILTKLVERLEHRAGTVEIPDNIRLDIARQESEASHNAMIHEAKRFILSHIQENICVNDIAEEVHLNAQYLMRLFKKEMGVSILEYITDERIKLAKEILVRTDYQISQVADSVGYGNYSYFTKIFRRSEGVSPRQYRQMHSRDQ